MSDTLQRPPLDMDLGTADPTFNVLKEGPYELKVDKAEITKTQKGARMLKLEMSTIIPAINRKGEQVSAGQKVFDQKMLEPTGKATWEMVTNNLIEVCKAAKFSAGQAKFGDIDKWAPTLNGRILKVQIGYEPAKTGDDGKMHREKHVVASYG